MNLLDLSLILFLFAIIIWVSVTYKYGDWRNWRIYYPTILFFWCGNLIGFSVFNNNLLWKFKSNILSHNKIDLLQMFFIFSCTAILFLQYYPPNRSSQIIYILAWVFIYSIIEYFFHLLGGIMYYDGWNIWWSVTHNIYQFILLKIHHKKPLLAWTFGLIILGIMMFIFKVR